MIDILKTVTPSAEQWEIVVEGARNSFNSWDKSDSLLAFDEGIMDEAFILGKNDMELLKRLAKGRGSDSKFRRMLPVWMTINAPLYWWKEFDTYKVGTAANSCSTMHKIAAKEFTPDDFSCEHLMGWSEYENDVKQFNPDRLCNFKFYMDDIISALNNARDLYLLTEDKKYWWQMIQLLPSSYNQRRTIMLNYEVLAKIFAERRNHKLDEWKDFCKVIESLPYSELITAGFIEED